MMDKIEFKLYFQDSKARSFIEIILKETDKDFIPNLSSKYKLDDIVEKYLTLAHNLIVFVQNEPAGMVSFYPNIQPENSYLSIICVRDKYRGMSIGKELEKKCIQFCKSYNSYGLSVSMRKSNLNLFNSRLNMGYKVEREYKNTFSEEVLVDMHMKF